jgi:hypothetical protein
VIAETRDIPNAEHRRQEACLPAVLNMKNSLLPRPALGLEVEGGPTRPALTYRRCISHGRAILRSRRRLRVSMKHETIREHRLRSRQGGWLVRRLSLTDAGESCDGSPTDQRNASARKCANCPSFKRTIIRAGSSDRGERGRKSYHIGCS